MKARKHYILVLLGLACVAIVSLRLSGQTDLEGSEEDEFGIYALEGLKGVSVKVVHRVSGFEETRFKHNQMDVNDLQALAEGILRRAGIEVCENPWRDPEIAELVIEVSVWKTKSVPSFVVQVRTELYQLAELVRGRRLRIMARTWPVGGRTQEAETTAVINLCGITKVVDKEVKDQISVFAEDYCTANRCNCPAMKGTVRYLDTAVAIRGEDYVIPGIEGGFYGIVADNGARYDPHNLPEEFAIDGLRVKFQVVEEKCMGGIHMWGKIVRIIWIETL
jgi:hypothetical protein